MPPHFQDEVEDVMPQSKTTGVSVIGQPQLGPYMFSFGEYRSENTISEVQNFEFGLPNFGPRFEQIYMQDTIPSTDVNNAVWMPPDLSISLDSGLSASIPSDTSDTRDFDPIELTIQGSQTAGLIGNFFTREQQIDYPNPVPRSTVDMSLHSESDAMPIGSTDSINAMKHHGNQDITLTRKRPIGRINDEIGDSLIEKKDALRITLSVLTNLSCHTIRHLAKEFKVSCDVVLDSCCPSASSPDSRSLICDNRPESDRSCLYRQEFEVSNTAKRGIPANLAEAEGSLVTKSPNKRAKSRQERLRVVDGEPQSQRYPCTKCDGSFTRPHDVLRHLKTHVPAQLHCPDIRCHRIFNRKDKLNDHIRKKHKVVDPESDMLQGRDQDPEDDSDDRHPLGSKLLHGAKTLCGPFQGTSSAAGAVSGNDKSSTGGMNDSSSDMEVFCPKSQKETADSYKRTFSCARVIRKLGHGGFGHVYELSTTNTHVPDQESFACKIIQVPSQDGHQVIKRARDEIRILQALDHPNIVSFAGAIISRDNIMINTRPVADCNLKEFLSQQSHPLSSTLKRQLWDGVCDLASALSYLHGQGTGGACHGDIKPENILVMQDDEVKSWVRLLLADFGSARLLTPQTRIGVNNGTFTPRYCAPEWFKGDGRGSPSDIWSFGCILTQVITYLYDRSMEDFYTFRGHGAMTNKYWTYHEYLPVVKNWLSTLPKTCSEPAQRVLCADQITLIFKMLSLVPQERPSATEVVATLQELSKLTAKVAPQGQNASEILMKKPKNILGLAPCISASCDSEVLNMIGLGQWSTEVPGIKYEGKDTDLREATLILDTTGDPLHVLRWRRGIDGSESPWMYYSLQDFGNSIEWCQKRHSTKNLYHAEESRFNGIILNSYRAEPITSSSFTVDLEPTDSQFTRNKAVYQEPGEHHSQIHITPVPERATLTDLEQFPRHRRDILPKELGPARSEPMKACWAGEKVQKMRPARYKTDAYKKKKPCCWKCQPKSHKFPFRDLRNSCRNYIPSPLQTMVSLRSPIAHNCAIFFPSMLYSHLKESCIQDFLLSNTIGFTMNEVKVEISSGPTYKPIKLSVHEFVPLSSEFLKCHYVETVSSGKSLQLVSSSAHTLPLGLYNAAEKVLRGACLEYIKLNITREQGIGEALGRGTSILLWKAYEAADRYRKGASKFRNHALLEKTAMLYMMQDFMSRMITITKTSALEVNRWLRDPKLANYEGQYQFSKILSLQLKGAMYSLMIEMNEEVLTELEWELEFVDKRQLSWASAFCINILLCIFTEDLQVAVDAFCVIKPGTPFHDTSGLDMMLRLDASCENIQKMFHKAFGIGSSSLNRKGAQSLNPIRDGLTPDKKKGVTQAEVDLVNDIRGIMLKYGHELEEKARNLSFKAEPNTLAHHMAFRERNSGRLVAKFLKSFA